MKIKTNLTEKEVTQYIRNAKAYFKKLRTHLDEIEADFDSGEKEKIFKAVIFSSCMMLCLEEMDNKLDETLQFAKNKLN